MKTYRELDPDRKLLTYNLLPENNADIKIMSMKEISYCIHKYSHHLIPLYVIFIRGWQPESH